MNKLVRGVAIAALLVSVASVHGPAQAANPAKGTLSQQRTEVSWSGGPFLVPRPVGCTTGDPTCDYYFLTVMNLPAGTEIEIKMTTPRSTSGLAPVDGDDFDLYVWSPDNDMLASGATNSGNERLIFKTHAKWRTYEVEIIPFIVSPGSSYKATARVL